MPILVPGTDDTAILDALKNIAGDKRNAAGNPTSNPVPTEIKNWIQTAYKAKVEGYSAKAPFAVPKDIKDVKNDSRYFFSYRDKLFSGIVRAKTQWEDLQVKQKALADAQDDLRKKKENQRNNPSDTNAANAVTTARAAVTTAKTVVTTAQQAYDLLAASPQTAPFVMSNIQQHMANGTTRRVIDNGDGKADISIEKNDAWKVGDNELFWDNATTDPFYKRVPQKNLLLEEQYYAVLKPYFQYVRLVAKYKAASDDTLKADTFNKISALFFESARKVQPNGKLPKYRPQDSHPIPGIPEITRINKDKIKVYWAGCEHYSYFVKIGYGDTVVWKDAKEITGTSKLVDATGEKLHVALAFARYNPMTNNVTVDPPSLDPDDDNAQDWSYKVFPLSSSTALPEHVVTMQLFDIDRFRLQLDKEYPDITIFDIFQMLQDDTLRSTNIAITAATTLGVAMDSLAKYVNGDGIFKASDYRSVKWEHIDVPVGRTNNESWKQFQYVQKVLTIHRSRIFDLSDQMKIHNIPSVVLDKDEYSRPAKYASVLGKRPNDPDFDVVDRAIQSARTNKFFKKLNSDNILNKPWQQAKHHFKVHERGRGTFFADFIYLNNRRETEACKRLRRTRRSLDLSRKLGVPVIPKKIIAPFPYVSNASSQRSTTFGVNNYDRMQSYPAVQELPRTFVPAAIPNLTEKVASTASLLPIDKKMRSATFYNIRVNSGIPTKELPHPGYPSRAKATAWQSIVNAVKLPRIPLIAINGGAAVIDDKPIVLEL